MLLSRGIKTPFYNSALKKVGYLGFGLSVIPSIYPSVRPSVIISSEQIDRFSPNFIYAIIFTRSRVGIVTHSWSHICTIVMWPLIYNQNFVSPQYLENKLTDVHQIFYMHSYWQNLGWDCYTSFFAYLYQSYGLCLYKRVICLYFLMKKVCCGYYHLKNLNEMLPMRSHNFQMFLWRNLGLYFE